MPQHKQHPPKPDDLLTLVERTSLPRLQVQGKGVVRYYAYVQAYIAGKRTRIKGVDVTPLYYLSLVAMRGEGTTLQGIWSSLVSSSSFDVMLDGIGTVVLAHHYHADLGYTLHWNYHQVTLPSQDLHSVIESAMLTVCDLVRGVAPLERVRRTPKKVQAGPGRKRARRETVVLSSRKRTELERLEEAHNRQHYPLFLLMVPGNVQPERQRGESEEEYLAHCQAAVRSFLLPQHFAFLDARVPWAMAPEWAAYLWERGITRGEITPLTTWCAPGVGADVEEEDGHDIHSSSPFLREAWLCQPNIALLPIDLKQARREGRIHSPVVAEDMQSQVVSTVTPEQVIVAGR